ncbi:MAG: DUF4430 domain-containing protein [Oscillospiraceae bacterium]|nr:DUF4430 domain-containing protein [Oscillospiraceae bacterium]
MKGKKGSVIAFVALVCVAALFVGAWFALRPGTNTGGKALTIEIVHGNGDAKEYKVQTEAEYLGQALLESEQLGVVGENGPYGLYITSVDGEEASDAAHTYWSVRKNGEDLMVGADQQPIADGEHYELVLAAW